MNKSLAILTTGIFCTLSASAYAAENPFSDVPTDHWSRDAVAQLAADGIITGYGDNTFRGDRAITRYEMAQMVAKAMAHGQTNLSATDKGLLDKLHVEYSAELTNLGVRVSNLERNADRVKFSGYAYLREQSQRIKNDQTGTTTNMGVNTAWLDLVMTAGVNKNWNVVGETNTIVDLKADTVNSDYNLKFVSMFAQGNYGKFSTQLGKIDNYSQDGGLVMHTPISGAKFMMGNRLRTTLTIARVSNSLASLNAGESFDYQALELAYTASKTTKLYAAAYRLHDEKFKTTRGTENPMIYTLGFQNKLAKNLTLSGYWLKASENTSSYRKDTGWYGALEYRSINLSQPGTWSLYTKYEYIPELTQLSMDVGHFRNYKGIEIGAFYIPAKNMRAHIRYYYGKNIEADYISKSLVRAELRIFF